MLSRSAFAAAFLVATVAHATPCTDAFEGASQASQAGHLLAARQALITCSAQTCPQAMRPLCIAEFARVDARIPTIVVSAVDARGADIVDASVSVDGAAVAGALDGKALPLDPGKHVVRVERSGGVAEQVIVAREGEQARPVRLTLASTAVVTGEARRPVPASVWVTTATTLVAAGIWIGFGTSGLLQKGDLDTCKGHCTPAAVASAMTAFNVADVAGAVTIVGLALDLVLFLTRRTVITPAVTASGLGARVTF